MKIHGLQKMTLLDFPGRVACTVFLGGCEFRCPFCHNSELLDANKAPAVMDDEELLSFLKKRKGLLDGVCITGGEPLLRGDLRTLIERIKGMGYPVKLDTNGNHPGILAELVENGLLDYVAMDIKNDEERYAKTCGLNSMDFSTIRESISILKEKQSEYEFRTTAVDELHDENSFLNIAQMIRGAKRYYLQAFKDRDTVKFSGFHAPGKEKMEKYLSIVKPYVQEIQLRGVE